VDGGEAWRSELVPVGDPYFLLCNSEQPATVPGCFSGTGSSCMLPPLCDLDGKQNVYASNSLGEAWPNEANVSNGSTVRTPGSFIKFK
jgi:hypothetical protein